MRYYKLFIITALSMAIFASCNKNHYEVSNVNGINAEGEVLLPVVSKTSTMMDLMERFKIDSLISCYDDGSLYYGLFYDCPNVVDAGELLKFNDLEYHQHIDLDTNYIQFVIPDIYDTEVSFDLPFHFNSDYLDVYEAWMRSGRFDFDIHTNVHALKRIVVRCSEIKDADGNVMELPFEISSGSFGFDIGGLHYVTEEANSFTFSFDIYLSVEWTNNPDFYLDIDITGSDLSLREMRGIVHPYVMPGVIDTTFDFFPSSVSGQLMINAARLRISERNDFGIDAELRVDTANVSASDLEPYSLFEPLPFIVPICTQMTMSEVRNQKFDAIIQAHGGRVHAAYYFTLNPHGTAEVRVSDTCSIDVQVGVDIPFAFRADEVRYTDTVKFLLDEIDTPDMLESLTIDIDIASTLPLNINGWFYLYDTETGMITDTLNPDGKLIVASFNGLPTSTTVSVEITEDRLANVFHSNRIIMMYEVDTDAREVKLNAQQELQISVKAKAKYDGTINLNN